MIRAFKIKYLIGVIVSTGLFLANTNQLAAYSRIISLKPNITEIVFALGMGDQLVGVTRYCTRPDAAKKITRVADYIRVNPEKTLSLKPDLILASQENSSQREVNFLKNRGIALELLSFSTIEETLQSIKRIGVVLKKETEAKKIVTKMRTQLEKLKRKNSKRKKKRVLFVVDYKPLVVAGGNNFFDEATEYLGVINVVRQSRLKYPVYSTEMLIHSNPEVIFDLGMNPNLTEAEKKSRRQWWQKFQSITAVKKNQIYAFSIEKMRATPTLPRAFEEMREMIFP